jgi:hypothetical protein
VPIVLLILFSALRGEVASHKGHKREAPQRVVSGEFATGNGLTSATAPMMSSLFPAGANLTSTGAVILWGYVCNPMTLLRRGRGTHAMVATLKRPPPGVPPSGTPTGDRAPTGLIQYIDETQHQ